MAPCCWRQSTCHVAKWLTWDSAWLHLQLISPVPEVIASLNRETSAIFVMATWPVTSLVIYNVADLIRLSPLCFYIYVRNNGGHNLSAELICWFPPPPKKKPHSLDHSFRTAVVRFFTAYIILLRYYGRRVWVGGEGGRLSATSHPKRCDPVFWCLSQFPWLPLSEGCLKDARLNYMFDESFPLFYRL